MKEEKVSYFILNEYGLYEYVGKFSSFEDADAFIVSNDFNGIASWIFSEENIDTLEESWLKTKENMSKDK